MTDPNEGQQPSFEKNPGSEPNPAAEPRSGGEAPASGPPPSGPPAFEKQPPPYGQPGAGTPPGFGQPSPGTPPPYGQPGPGTPPNFGPPAGQPYGFPPAPQVPPGAPVGPGGPGGMVYDPSGIYLPAGTQLASHGRRIGAFFLAIPLFIVTLGIGYIVWGLILWGRGTTPALKVLGMRCWNVSDNSVPGFWRMVLREVLGRIVDGIVGIITQIVSFVLFLSTDKRQSLHDFVGGTTVLHDPNKVLG